MIIAASLFSEKKPPLLIFGGGIFDVTRKHPKMQYQIEYRSSYDIYERDFLFIRPLIGMMGTEKGALYGYGGICFDIFLGKYLVFSPSFAPGLYYDGKGKRLGFPLQFRSSAELSLRFPNKMRLGAQFYHISNGSVGWKNPGTESLVFILGIPIH
ncbi:MAG: acyloxyacyl hydrolase [Simkaniaceae bacterium]